MPKWIANDSFKSAEIIIDFKKKKVDILDTNTRESRLNTKNNFTFVIVFGFLELFLIPVAIVLNPSKGGLSYFFTMNAAILIIILIKVLSIKYYKEWHELLQFILNDYFETKKFLIIKDIKSKTYQLPDYLDFSNVKLDFNLYKDYKKYINKIHIKPKDYYLIFGKTKEKQNEKWDCIFYFSQVPREGMMELTLV